MLVDVAMFLLMGLAVAYLVARMGDGASQVLVAYAAALLTVVGLSFLLAALGEQLEGSYDRAVARFVASLVGAFIGVRLATRQRSLISAGADLPIWIGDKSVGPVLAGVVVIGVALLQLNRVGIGFEPIGHGNSASVWNNAASPNGQPSVALGPSGAATPVSQSDATGKPEQVSASTQQADGVSPAQQTHSKNLPAGAPSQPAHGASSPPSKATKNDAANLNAKTATAAAASTEPSATRSIAPSAAAAQSLCGDWYGFANMVRTCVALPCQQCRGQQEMRHALIEKSVVEFSRGFVDCNSRVRSAIELGNRCIAADNRRALSYGAYFLAHPHAPAPKNL